MKEPIATKEARIAVRLNPLLLKLATAQAEKENVTLSQIFRQALIVYLGQRS